MEVLMLKGYVLQRPKYSISYRAGKEYTVPEEVVREMAAAGACADPWYVPPPEPEEEEELEDPSEEDPVVSDVAPEEGEVVDG